jgi:hypothetical protein
MDSYDPSFNPDMYDPQRHPPVAPNDPDMGYIHNDRPPPPRRSDPEAGPGVDAGVYDDGPHPGYQDDLDHHDDVLVGAVDHDDDDIDDDILYGDDDPRYGSYPEGDIPAHVGVRGGSYAADDNGNYNDGFDDDDDVYLDNDRKNHLHQAQHEFEIESTHHEHRLTDEFWRNCVMICTCLFIIAGIIFLSVRISQISNQDAQKTLVVHTRGVLVPPPPELAQKCTNERVLSEKGFYECEMLCEAADCCNYPTALALSCLAGHDDECLTYHEHCNVLDLDHATLVNPPPIENIIIPQAPDDIQYKCNVESLLTVPGFEACVNDCMQAVCCWKKDSSVNPCPSLPNCAAYSPCLAMDATDYLDVNIGKEVEYKCADDKIDTEVGRNQCIFACSHAACCFDPDTSCPHEDATFCNQYSACQKIFDAKGSIIRTSSPSIPQAPQFLDTACSKSSLDTLPGYEMCLGACTEAECCWKGDASCLSQHACDGYQHCVLLLEEEAMSTSAPGDAENTFPEAPQYLAAACSAASLDTNAGFTMCQDACMKAECCWKVTSCKERSECFDYATSCANLVARWDQTGGGGTDPVTALLPEAPHDLGDICEASKVLTTEGYSSCQTECTKTECCWKAGSTNSCVENSQCQPWAPCTVLNGAQDPAVAASQDYSLEQVFDACLNHDNSVGRNHTSLCQVVCQAGTCCFDETEDCPNTLDCKVFEPCQLLHTEKASQVDKACDGTDLAECVGVCAAATCCFTNDIAKICDVTSPNIICRQYKACEILYKAESTSP